jgi:hypothetical protein
MNVKTDNKTVVEESPMTTALFINLLVAAIPTPQR